MPGEKTVVIFVHGANQGSHGRQETERLWTEGFANAGDAFMSILSGARNAEIQAFHAGRDGVALFPQYAGHELAWYGCVWEQYCKPSDAEKRQGADFRPGAFAEGGELNQHRTDEYLNRLRVLSSILDKKARNVMDKGFDELVPFYELWTLKATGTTLYEEVCKSVAQTILRQAEAGFHYILIGHSMGCAVSYNVLTHIGQKRAGRPLTHIREAVGTAYEDVIGRICGTGKRCLGLLTFGNYTGYDWALTHNHNILYGILDPKFRVPPEAPIWRNFWTVLGGDPVVLDDMLKDSNEDSASGMSERFRDVPIFRTPFVNVGHERPFWFKRKDFVRKLSKALMEACMKTT